MNTFIARDGEPAYMPDLDIDTPEDILADELGTLAQKRYVSVLDVAMPYAGLGLGDPGLQINIRQGDAGNRQLLDTPLDVDDVEVDVVAWRWNHARQQVATAQQIGSRAAFDGEGWLCRQQRHRTNCE